MFGQSMCIEVRNPCCQFQEGLQSGNFLSPALSFFSWRKTQVADGLSTARQIVFLTVDLRLNLKQVPLALASLALKYSDNLILIQVGVLPGS